MHPITVRVRRSLALIGLVGALTVPRANGQSFNVDVGVDPGATTFGTPPASYGAAPFQAGHWNAARDGQAGLGSPPPAASQWYVTALSSLADSPTPVVLSVNVSPATDGLGDVEFDHSGTSGNLQTLYDDFGDVGSGPSSQAWVFSNLLNATYDLYVHAWNPSDAGAITVVHASDTASQNPQVCGGAWPGGHQQGTTFTLHAVVVTNNTIVIQVGAQSGRAVVNGTQLVVQGSLAAGNPFCPGDGSGTPCPCGNNSALNSGAGCLNSLGTGGRLDMTGTASVSGDTILLLGSNLPNSSALYYQGTLRLNGGAGVVFGDGLRCLGGALVRLGTKTSIGGTSQYPSGADASVSVRGMVPPGATRVYQVWYRNAANFCTTSTFNLSAAVELVWGT